MLDFTFLFLYNESNHKECVRDSPVDRTATYYISKVLKAERWAINHAINPSLRWVFLLPLCG